MAGDCVFLAPDHAHSIACDAGSIGWSNIAMHAGELGLLCARHAADLGWWPWSGQTPHLARLSKAQARRLLAEAEGVPVTGQVRRHLDHFATALIDILAELPRPTETASATWLDEALLTLRRDPARLRHGLPALIALCRRSPRHIARAVRARHACTSEEFVLRLRLEAAADLLVRTSDGVLDIALACGFSSLSHFYRRFHARFGMTPAALRRETEP